MPKILVTGSSGTVGTRLCERLLEKGFDVIGVDFKDNPWSEKINEITIKVDLRNKEEVFELPKDFDVVIHLAANARVPHAVKNPELSRDNFVSLFNILEFCRLNGIKKFMFASSKDVYGNAKTEYKEDDLDITACESPYAASKIGGEALVYSYSKCYDLDYVVFRLTNVYGMYDELDRVIPIFIRLTKEGKDITVNGANKLLDFIYIDDAIDGILLCLKKFDEVKNDVFNIAYGEGTSLLEMAEIIKKKLNGENKILIGESKEGDVVKSVSDISKAKGKLGFSPKVGIEEGLEKSISFFQLGNQRSLYSL